MYHLNKVIQERSRLAESSLISQGLQPNSSARATLKGQKPPRKPVLGPCFRDSPRITPSRQVHISLRYHEQCPSAHSPKW